LRFGVASRPDIRDRAALEQNFREKFEALNRVKLTDTEFARLLDESSPRMSSPPPRPCASINSLHPRRRHAAELHAGQHQGLVQEHFEVINQLRINTDYSHHRYDVILLINGVPCVQIELKTLASTRAGPWSRSSNTRTTPATATPRRCSASCSSSSSATATAPTTSPTTTPATFSFNADERFLPAL
jgi:type I restriction enzyme R subunit